MKLPLLIAGKPREGLIGPLVFLPFGEWLIEHNLVSSSVSIQTEDGSIFDIPTSTITNRITKGDQTIRILMDQAHQVGNEKEITIYAVKQ